MTCNLHKNIYPHASTNGSGSKNTISLVNPVREQLAQWVGTATKTIQSLLLLLKKSSVFGHLGEVHSVLAQSRVLMHAFLVP